MKYVIASHKIYIIYQYFFGIRMCQVLEVVRNGKIGVFYPFYKKSGQISPCKMNMIPKNASNPDTIIIPLPKNDRMLVLVKISFLAIICINIANKSH